MTAVFADGHWRRRDALEGLSAGMRAALIFATVMGGGLASAGSRRTRDWGARMRAESGS